MMESYNPHVESLKICFFKIKPNGFCGTCFCFFAKQKKQSKKNPSRTLPKNSGERPHAPAQQSEGVPQQVPVDRRISFSRMVLQRSFQCFCLHFQMIFSILDAQCMMNLTIPLLNQPKCRQTWSSKDDTIESSPNRYEISSRCLTDVFPRGAANKSTLIGSLDLCDPIVAG